MNEAWVQFSAPQKKKKLVVWKKKDRWVVTACQESEWKLNERCKLWNLCKWIYCEKHVGSTYINVDKNLVRASWKSLLTSWGVIMALWLMSEMSLLLSDVDWNIWRWNMVILIIYFKINLKEMKQYENMLLIVKFSKFFLGLIFFVVGIRIFWTPSFVLARQALYCLSNTSSP
jgi:hypothetical protein